MGTFMLYIIKWAFCLILLLIAYKFTLSKMTFHRFNRFVLLGILVISALLPFINIPIQPTTYSVTSSQIMEQIKSVQVPELTPITRTSQNNSSTTLSFNWAAVTIYLYLLMVTYFVFMWIKSTANIIHLKYVISRKHHIQGVTISIYEGDKGPFSWINNIFISSDDMDDNMRMYILHEYAHVHYYHYLDLFLISICIVINPAVLLILDEIKIIHEYEADEYVLKRHINAANYQTLLIKKSVGAEAYALANSFKNKNLKKRIIMMLKKKTSNVSKSRALIAIPVIAISLIAFAKPETTEHLVYTLNDVNISELPRFITPETEPEPVNNTKKETKKAKKIKIPSRIPASTIKQTGFDIKGVWELQKAELNDTTYDYTKMAGYKQYKIMIDGGTYYCTEILFSNNNAKIYPHQIGKYQYTTDGKYIENDEDMNITIVSSNEFTNTWNKRKQTWKRVNITNDFRYYIIKKCNEELSNNNLNQLLKKNGIK
jgi:beta-lactamase regulating signal transducer with metallopeptidase domain